MPNSKTYHAEFLRFMRFWQKKKFASDQNFRPSELRRIKPFHIVQYFHHKAWGKTTVNYRSNNDQPKYQRLNSLNFSKSAISHYMPDQDMQWNERDQCGNPTRSKAVKSCLDRVGEMEKLGLGAPSQKKRDMHLEEFLLLKTLFQSVNDCFTFVVKCCTYSVLAFHLIFRSDDVSWLKVQDVRRHPKFNFGLSVKVK